MSERNDMLAEIESAQDGKAPLSPKTCAGIDRFGHFLVARREDGELDRLGIGAMGVTYRALDTQLDRPVALKTIHPQWVDDPEVRSRFAREARAAARLQHPNIASVLFQGEEASVCFYVMELVVGEDLHHYIRRVGPLSPVHALRMAHQISLALVAASRERIIHRDLKPANVMLTSYQDGTEPHLKVIDFGLAKLAADSPATFTTCGFMGTPEFASPEQCEERDLDARSDIYSLGGVLWFLLTAATPFTGSLLSVIRAQISAVPAWEKLPGAPKPLLALLKRLLAKDRDFRPASPIEASREIEHAIQLLSQDLKNFHPLVAGSDAAGTSHLVRAASLPAQPTGGMANASARQASHRWVLPACVSLLCFAGGIYAWKASRTKDEVIQPGTASSLNAPLVETTKILPSVPSTPAPQSSPPDSPIDPPYIIPVLAPSTKPNSEPIAATRLPAAESSASGSTFTNSLGMRFVRPPGSGLLISIWETRVRDFAAYAAHSSTLTSIASDPRERSWRNPGFAQTGEHPVVCISPPEAVAFCRWLTEKEQKAGLILPSEYYRLPARVEWDELLMGPPTGYSGASNGGWQPGMAGTGNPSGEPQLPPPPPGYPPPFPRPPGPAPFFWGTFTWPAPPRFANYGAGAYSMGTGSGAAGDGFAFTSPVGSFEPNTFGLYDMSGNAREICVDGPPLTTTYVKQGASWASNTQEELRRNYVVQAQAGQRDATTGFRCVIARSR